MCGFNVPAGNLRLTLSHVCMSALLCVCMCVYVWVWLGSAVVWIKCQREGNIIVTWSLLKVGQWMWVCVQHGYMFVHVSAFQCLRFAACTEMTNGSRSIDSQVYWGLYSREVLWSAASHDCFIIIYCHDPMTSHHTLQEIRPPLFRSWEWNGGGGHSAQSGRFMWLCVS